MVVDLPLLLKGGRFISSQLRLFLWLGARRRDVQEAQLERVGTVSLEDVVGVGAQKVISVGTKGDEGAALDCAADNHGLLDERVVKLEKVKGWIGIGRPRGGWTERTARARRMVRISE